MKSLRQKKRSNLWMTHDIIKLMYERDHIHAKATQSNDSKLLQISIIYGIKSRVLSRGERMSISMIFTHSAEMT